MPSSLPHTPFPHCYTLLPHTRVDATARACRYTRHAPRFLFPPTCAPYRLLPPVALAIADMDDDMAVAGTTAQHFKHARTYLTAHCAAGKRWRNGAFTVYNCCASHAGPSHFCWVLPNSSPLPYPTGRLPPTALPFVTYHHPPLPRDGAARRMLALTNTWRATVRLRQFAARYAAFYAHCCLTHTHITTHTLHTVTLPSDMSLTLPLHTPTHSPGRAFSLAFLLPPSGYSSITCSPVNIHPQFSISPLPAGIPPRAHTTHPTPRHYLPPSLPSVHATIPHLLLPPHIAVPTYRPACTSNGLWGFAERRRRGV